MKKIKRLFLASIKTKEGKAFYKTLFLGLLVFYVSAYTLCGHIAWLVSLIIK